MEKLTPGPITKGRISDLVFLEWVVPGDGYQIEERPENKAMSASAGLYLAPTGSSAFVYRPMEKHPAMFREFADVELTPEGVVGFANKYGAPFGDTGHGYSGLPMTAVPGVKMDLMHFGNELEYIYGCIQSMRHAVTQYEAGERSDWVDSGHPLGRADIRFASVNGSLNLIIHPDSLMDAMWIQFARLVAGNVQIRKCAQCPVWFPFGTGTKRRKSAIYCSGRCRRAAYDQRRGPRK